MKKWVLCKQTIRDSVRYMTPDLDTPSYMGYYSFIDYVKSIPVFPMEKFVEELNKFKTLLIDLEKHTWQEYKEEKQEDFTFDELYKLNNSPPKKDKLGKLRNFVNKQSKIQSNLVILDDPDRNNK